MQKYHNLQETNPGLRRCDERLWSGFKACFSFENTANKSPQGHDFYQTTYRVITHLYHTFFVDFLLMFKYIIILIPVIIQPPFQLSYKTPLLSIHLFFQILIYLFRIFTRLFGFHQSFQNLWVYNKTVSTHYFFDVTVVLLEDFLDFFFR